MDKELKKLYEQRNDKLEEMDKLTHDENGEVRSTAMTEEETQKFDTLEAEVRALTETIDRIERRRKQSIEKADPEKRAEAEKEEAEKRAFVAYVRNTFGSLDEETRAAANFTVTDNTAVIPSSIARKIIEEVKDRCRIFDLASKYNVKGDLIFPVWDESDGGITMEYAEEFTEPKHTAGKFTSVKLTSYLARVTTLISKSLLNNAAFDLFTYIVGKVSEAVADFLEKEMLCGTMDKIEGLSKVEAKITTLDSDSLIDLQDSIKGAFQSRCRWIMSPATKNKIRKFKDGQGNYLLERDYANGTGAWHLLGKPIELTDVLEEGEIYYGDFSGLAVKIVENPAIEVIREKYYEQHAVGLCVWLEMDGKVIEPQKIAKLKTGE